MKVNADKVVVDKNVLRKYCNEILVRHGISNEDANTTMDVLLFADLRGVDSHGALRFPLYVRRLEKGLMCPTNNIKVLADSLTTCVIDGGNYLGPVAAVLAMNKAIEKAKEYTVGMSFVRNNHHYGAAAYYAMMALEYDMIGFTTTNTAPLMAPTGGKKRLVGNNPLSFAAPAGRFKPFVLDIACSVVAAGKIALARKNNQSIPLGWALNRAGQPTENAYEGFEGGGMLLPIGGHKGYGMAVMLDILSGVLSGAAFGANVQSLANLGCQEPIGTGHFMMALNIDDIMSIDCFKSRMDELIGEIKACPKADDVEEIYIPGEIEYNTFSQRNSEGIPLSKAVLADILDLGKAAGLGEM